MAAEGFLEQLNATVTLDYTIMENDLPRCSACFNKSSQTLSIRRLIDFEKFIGCGELFYVFDGLVKSHESARCSTEKDGINGHHELGPLIAWKYVERPLAAVNESEEDRYLFHGIVCREVIECRLKWLRKLEKSLMRLE